jgi:tetratricopeptide (TPR) repeat protein
MRRLLLIGLCAGACACAPKIVPPPVVTTPRFPEFVRPSVPRDFERSAAAINEDRGWAFLQNGDLKTAEREFSAALANAPQFFPADISLGYVELARRDAGAALPHFERAIERQPTDLSALHGRAQALVALNRDADALAAFEAILAVDPNQLEIRREVEVLRFRGSEQGVQVAREAARAGRLDQAVRAYTAAIAASPESPFLYRELAAVERRQGNTTAALEHFRKAAALDPSDARSLEQIGDLLDAQHDLDGAVDAYSRVLAMEADAAVARKLEAVRAKAAFEMLPAEYRAIDQAPQITRGDLAALIGVRLSPLLEATPSNDDGLITDVRNHWAASWIVSVTRAGIMEPFPNHAFQPRTIVRRADLAQIAARLLTRVAAARSTPPAWTSARIRFADLAPGHLAYPAASITVAAGVMKTPAESTFQPARPVTGAEAIEAIQQIQALAGIK